MTRCAGSCGRRENKYRQAKVSQHCNDFADDVDEFPARRKSSTVNVDLYAFSGPLPRFSQPANHDARHHPQGKEASHTMAETFIPTEQYRAAVNAIAAKTNLDPDEIKTALGEQGDIWPMSIRCDTDRAI